MTDSPERPEQAYGVEGGVYAGVEHMNAAPAHVYATPAHLYAASVNVVRDVDRSVRARGPGFEWSESCEQSCQAVFSSVRTSAIS
jgi:hypothetical protein